MTLSAWYLEPEVPPIPELKIQEHVESITTPTRIAQWPSQAMTRLTKKLSIDILNIYQGASETIGSLPNHHPISLPYLTTHLFSTSVPLSFSFSLHPPPAPLPTPNPHQSQPHHTPPQSDASSPSHPHPATPPPSS